MAIHVKSEIGKLKKVMLHRPGQELEHLVPEDLERLLFDDIPYLKTAKIEHDMFAEIMRGQGVEVVYLEDLTADVLKNPEKKEQFVREFIAEGGASAAKVRDQLYDYLMKISDEKELVLKTMSGIRASELNVKMSCPLVSLVKKESQFLLDPIPNLYYQRSFCLHREWCQSEPDVFPNQKTGNTLRKIYFKISSGFCRKSTVLL